MSFLDRHAGALATSQSPGVQAMSMKQTASADMSTPSRGLGALASRIPGPLIGLVVIMVALSILSPYFLTVPNLMNILSQVSDVGIMAIGAALVIFTGGIDLSVGAVLSLSLMTSAWLFHDHGVPFALGVIAGLLVGALVGLINGVLSNYARIQPFVATLATMSACSGIALFLTNGHPITGFPDWYTAVEGTRVFGIVPLEAIICISLFLSAAFWLQFRPGGRAIYAVGGNEEVARLSGLNVQRVRVTVYVIAGLLAALAGVIDGSRLDTAIPTIGQPSLLNVIAVVVIGGASLAGGSGTMLNTFIGLLIIGVLNNGMALLDVSPNLQPVVIGITIVLAVLTDRRVRF